MSVRSSSSSSGADAVSFPDNGRYYDTCTFVGPKYGLLEGCYMYRSCQSCLLTPGCLINDYGICVSEYDGMYSLQDEDYTYNTAYNPSMNYIQGLTLAVSDMVNSTNLGVDGEQNWHFRASETTYCSTSDPVCQDCKKQNFWRDADTLPDSRFCVGEMGCVCIQTCEVPTYKTPGCQWKLSTSNNNYNNGYYYGTTYNIEEVSWWEWMIIITLIIVLPLIIKLCCADSRAEKRDKRLAEAAKRAVRQELEIPDAPAQTDIPVVVLRAPARPRRQETVLTEESLTPRSLRDEDIMIDSPHADYYETPTVFVEIDEQRSSHLRSPV